MSAISDLVRALREYTKLSATFVKDALAPQWNPRTAAKLAVSLTVASIFGLHLREVMHAFWAGQFLLALFYGVAAIELMINRGQATCAWVASAILALGATLEAIRRWFDDDDTPE